MKFTKYNYLSLLFFIVGYSFSLSAPDHNIKEILYNNEMELYLIKKSGSDLNFHLEMANLV